MVSEHRNGGPSMTPAPCRVIAAIDGNHHGDADVARRLIDAAREAGADGVKLQKRTSTSNGKAPRPTDLSTAILAALCEHARGLELLMAPQDLDACRELSWMEFSAWQVDSPLATHLPLLESLRASERPVLVSVGGCTEREISEVVRCFPARSLTLVHSLGISRPAAGLIDAAALSALKRFGLPIGYADGSLDRSPSLMAVALGATVIEKPLSLHREHDGTLLPHELEELIRQVRDLEAVLRGASLRDPSPEEMDDLERERVSIVAAHPIARGTKIRREMLTLKAPFGGLSPACLDFLEGRRALYDIGQDEFLTFGMVEL